MNKVTFRWLFVLLLLLFALFQLKAFGQGMVVDSITWEVYEVEQEGNPKCKHKWVSSGQYDPQPGTQCAVMHAPGEICSYHWPHEDRICKKCGRMEHLRSIVHQHWQSPPKTPYQKELERWQKADTTRNSVWRWEEDALILPVDTTVPRPYWDDDLLIIPYPGVDSLYKVSPDTTFAPFYWIDTTNVYKKYNNYILDAKDK